MDFIVTIFMKCMLTSYEAVILTIINKIYLWKNVSLQLQPHQMQLINYEDPFLHQQLVYNHKQSPTPSVVHLEFSYNTNQNT